MDEMISIPYTEQDYNDMSQYFEWKQDQDYLNYLKEHNLDDFVGTDDQTTAKDPLGPDGSSMDFYSLLQSIFGFTTDGDNNPSYDMDSLMKQYMEFVRDNTDYNNSWSAEQAEKQMDFQKLSQKLAQQFNSKEAAKNRKWQEYMSNTAHQREIADLKKSGLNPVLSAMGGNGAAVTSGATAAGSSPTSGAKGDADQSANAAITSMMGSMVSTMSHLAEAAMSAQTQMGVAEKYTEMSKIIEQMQEAYKEHEHQSYPDTMWENISVLITSLFGSVTGFGDKIAEIFEQFLPDNGKDYSYGDKDAPSKVVEEWLGKGTGIQKALDEVSKSMEGLFGKGYKGKKGSF